MDGRRWAVDDDRSRSKWAFDEDRRRLRWAVEEDRRRRRWVFDDDRRRRIWEVDDYPPLQLPLQWRDPPPHYSHVNSHRRRRRPVDIDRRPEDLRAAQIEASLARIDALFSDFNRSLERITASTNKLSSDIYKYSLQHSPPQTHSLSLRGLKSKADSSSSLPDESKSASASVPSHDPTQLLSSVPSDDLNFHQNAKVDISAIGHTCALEHSVLQVRAIRTPLSFIHGSSSVEKNLYYIDCDKDEAKEGCFEASINLDEKTLQHSSLKQVYSRANLHSISGFSHVESHDLKPIQHHFSPDISSEAISVIFSMGDKLKKNFETKFQPTAIEAEAKSWDSHVEDNEKEKVCILHVEGQTLKDEEISYKRVATGIGDISDAGVLMPDVNSTNKADPMPCSQAVRQNVSEGSYFKFLGPVFSIRLLQFQDPWAQRRHSLADPMVVGEIHICLEQGEEFHGKLLNFWKDSTPLINRMRLMPMADDDGIMTHIIGIQLFFKSNIDIINVTYPTYKPTSQYKFNLDKMNLPGSELSCRSQIRFEHCGILQLSDEVLTHILSRLTPRDIALVGSVCTRMHKLTKNEKLMKILCQNAWGKEVIGKLETNGLLGATSPPRLDHGAAKQQGKVGITLPTYWFEPYDNNPTDKEAQKRALEFNFGWFMDPLEYGDYPFSMRSLVKERLPFFSAKESEKLKGSYDFIGLNYYTARYAQSVPFPAANLQTYNDDIYANILDEKNGVPIEHAEPGSWINVYPRGLRELLLYIKERYNNPAIYITENGVLEKDTNLPISEAIVDPHRTEYLTLHLHELTEALRLEANVKGYFTWSLLDNFEWNSGYTSRLGLHYIDFKDKTLKKNSEGELIVPDRTRTKKNSALWLKRFLNIKRKAGMTFGPKIE